jgi:rubrerythrin
VCFAVYFSFFDKEDTFMNYPTDRALQIAVEMERLGQTFYESLAQGCGDAAIAALALGLARDEKLHVAVFAHMLEALPPGLRGPKLTEQELFAAAKELRVNIMPGAATVRNAVLGADIGKALDMAIDMESKAVDYYTGKSFGAEGIDSAALSKIAEEEKKHLSTLQERRLRHK